MGDTRSGPVRPRSVDRSPDLHLRPLTCAYDVFFELAAGQTWSRTDFWWTRSGHERRDWKVPVSPSERRRFGQITKLRAVDTELDTPTLTVARPSVVMPSGTTLLTRLSKQDAEAWLTDERRPITSGVWASPAERQAERRRQATHIGRVRTQMARFPARMGLVRSTPSGWPEGSAVPRPPPWRVD